MTKTMVLYSLLILGLVGVSQAQEAKKDTSYWKKNTQLGANFNQGSFSNWQAGGVNSIALGLLFNAKGEYAKDKTGWVNDLQLQYGFVKNQGQSFRKSVDRIFFDSKVSHKLSAKWSLFGNLNFQSQFTQGFKYGTDNAGKETKIKISNLFAPAFITESIGLEYKPVSYFTVQFAPGAVRQTIVADDKVRATPTTAAYGVEPGKKLRNEIALIQIVATFDKDIAKNVNFKARYQLYANYKDLGAIDNLLEAKLAAKVNEFMNVTLGVILLYDQDQSYQMQYAQSFALGFLYKFK